MALSDIRLNVMPPMAVVDLARDKNALLKMPAQVFWAHRRGEFGWSEIGVDAALAKAKVYLKSVLNIELDARKIRTQPPPLRVFFRSDPDPVPERVIAARFNSQRVGRLRIYFVDFLQTSAVGVAHRGRDVVLMNGQNLKKRLTAGVSSFGRGSNAGLTLVHEIGHSLNLEHPPEDSSEPEPGLMYPRLHTTARDGSMLKLELTDSDYYLARLYGLLHKRLERSDTSLL